MIRRGARALLAAFAWLFVVGVVVQVFFAGMGLFEVTDMRFHIGLGYTLPYVLFVLGLIGLVAWPDRRTGLLIIALVLLGGFVQPMLPWFRTVSPVISAFHPPNALLVFWLGIVVARRATVLARARPAA